MLRPSPRKMLADPSVINQAKCRNQAPLLGRRLTDQAPANRNLIFLRAHLRIISHHMLQSQSRKPGGTRRPLLPLLAPSAAKPPSLEPRTELLLSIVAKYCKAHTARNCLDSICHLQEDKYLACLQRPKKLTCAATSPGGFRCPSWATLSSTS